MTIKDDIEVSKNRELHGRALVAICSPVLDSARVDEFQSCIEKEGFSWDVFIGVCARHKVMTYALQQFREYGILDTHVPYRVWGLYSYLADTVKRRNIELLEVRDEIIDKMRSVDVDIRSTKGGSFVQVLYPDLMSRLMYDLDFITLKSSVKKVQSALTELGFVQGRYDANSDILYPLTKKEYLRASQNTYVLPAFIKRYEGSVIVNAYVDVAHGMGHSDDTTIEMILKEKPGFETTDTLSLIDSLVHTCVHLHKEASKELWIRKAHGINLIKFIDVFKLILHCESSGISAAAVHERTKKLNVAVETSYAIGSLAEIYSHSYISELVALFEPDMSSEMTITDNFENVVAVRTMSILEAMGSISEDDTVSID